MNDPQLDELLTRTLATPVPQLSSDFDERVLLELRPASRAELRRRQTLLGSYAILSALASAFVMQSQGLGWPLTLVLVAVPFLLAVPLTQIRD